MNKIFTLLLVCSLAGIVRAQTTVATPGARPYGKVDQADLDMKQCDFEKDANAEVLFETATVYYTDDLNSISMEVHRRIKIFNDNGNKEADIRLPYISSQHYEYITGVQAETINFVDGKPVITKLEKKDIFTKLIDKESSEIAFTMPNVKPGCIIEYKYKWNTSYYRNMPMWFFQNSIPTRYSEFSTAIPDLFTFKPQAHLFRQLAKNTSTPPKEEVSRTYGLMTDHRNHVDSYPYILEQNLKAMVNIPSLPTEPFMSSFIDNAESIRFQLITIKPINGFTKTGTDTWAKSWQNACRR